MRDHIESVILANQTMTDNYGFVIKTTYGDKYDESNPHVTELDKIWAGGPIARYDFTHQKYVTGSEIAALYYTNNLYQMIEGVVCEPPYTGPDPCIDLSLLDVLPPVLQCGVGLIPMY